MITIEEGEKLLDKIHLLETRDLNLYEKVKDRTRKQWQEAGLVENPTAAIDEAREMLENLKRDPITTDDHYGARMGELYEQHITELEKQLGKSTVKEGQT